MASLDKNLLERIRSIDVASLARIDLGVHLNFDSINKTVLSFQVFLLEIANKSEGRLTDQDVQVFSNRAERFIQIADGIKKFNPSNQDYNVRNALIKQVESEWQQARHELRTVYNYLKLESLDVDSYQKATEKILRELELAKAGAEKLFRNLQQLPTDTESKYNSLFSDIQKKLEHELKKVSSELNGYTHKYETDLEEQKEFVQKLQIDFNENISKLSKQIEDKIKEVEQQARKFSAKGAITTYSQIYATEAEKVNKIAIEKWERVLVSLVLVEIFLAISMYLFFKSEMGFASTAELVGIVFIKIFILSAVAVLISYAVKNLNAQNHLYATNKFKANSLSSFQAFIEATTDDKIIDQIIRHVSIAVYSQNISGYLSKDDSGNLTQKDILDFASKITLGKKSE